MEFANMFKELSRAELLLSTDVICTSSDDLSAHKSDCLVGK